MEVVKKGIIAVSILAISILLLTIGQGNKMYKDALNNMPLEQKVAKLREKRDYVKINDIPDIYIKAVIAVEDHRFYRHNGVDPIAIFRAIYHDIKALSLIEGGSTITQQLCKNMYFTQEKKLTRKVAEAFMAWKVESKYEKDEILEMYINQAYFGSGYYGIKQASNGYFNKEPKDMTDYESTLLVGIPNAPTSYSLNANNGFAKKRQKQVLNRMVSLKLITEEEANEIIENE